MDPPWVEWRWTFPIKRKGIFQPQLCDRETQREQFLFCLLTQVVFPQKQTPMNRATVDLSYLAVGEAPCHPRRCLFYTGKKRVSIESMLGFAFKVVGKSKKKNVPNSGLIWFKMVMNPMVECKKQATKTNPSMDKLWYIYLHLVIYMVNVSILAVNDHISPSQSTLEDDLF